PLELSTSINILLIDFIDNYLLTLTIGRSPPGSSAAGRRRSERRGPVMHGCLPVAPAACLCLSRVPPFKLLLIKPATRSYVPEHKSLRAPPHRSGTKKGRSPFGRYCGEPRWASMRKFGAQPSSAHARAVDRVIVSIRSCCPSPADLPTLQGRPSSMMV